jgi:hypothetical protein
MHMQLYIYDSLSNLWTTPTTFKFKNFYSINFINPSLKYSTSNYACAYGHNSPCTNFYVILPICKIVGGIYQRVQLQFLNLSNSKIFYGFMPPSRSCVYFGKWLPLFHFSICTKTNLVLRSWSFFKKIITNIIYESSKWSVWWIL